MIASVAQFPAKTRRSHGGRNLAAFTANAERSATDTRTSAYLWTKTHRPKAEQLLTDPTCLASLPTPPVVPEYEAWLQQLRNEAIVARNCNRIALEWFLMTPESDGCTVQPQAVEHQRKLAAQVAELLLEIEDRPRD
ncbi:MAG: hypothetical protein FWD57_02555 [Polyangiaceae bacterium]|nr:hypothetical protein [Polyangiaceae bacterium]